jgi:hypothetical protein
MGFEIVVIFMSYILLRCFGKFSNSPNSSPNHITGLGIMANVCDHNRKKIIKICGKRIDFLRMIRNTKPESPIPTMKPLAEG